MTYRQRLLKGSVFNLIAVAFNQGSTLLANVFVAHLLVQEKFGEYSMVQVTLLTIATISQVSTGYTASKYIAEYRLVDPAKASRVMGACASLSLVMAVISTVLLIPCAPLLASSVLSSPHLSESLMLGALFVFFATINGYQMGALAGLEAFGGLAKAGMASGIMAVATVTLGAWLGQVDGAIAGLGLGAVFRCAIHYAYLQLAIDAHRLKPTYFEGIRQEKTIVCSFALPATLASLYSLPIIWFANAILFRQPGGYKEMALYTAASSIRILTLFFPQVINTVSLSILNNARSGRDPSQHKAIYLSNIAIISVVVIVAAATVDLLGEWILAIFGDEFVEGAPILRILMLAAIFEGVSIAMYQQLQSQGRIWLSLCAIIIPRELLFVTLAWILVPTQGASGLGLAYAISWFLTLLTIYALVRRECQVDPLEAGG